MELEDIKLIFLAVFISMRRRPRKVAFMLSVNLAVPSVRSQFGRIVTVHGDREVAESKSITTILNCRINSLRLSDCPTSYSWQITILVVFLPMYAVYKTVPPIFSLFNVESEE